jgi:hypothetical protein
MPSMRDGRAVGQHQPADAGLHRRGAAPHRPRHRPRHRRDPRDLGLLGGRCAPLRAFESGLQAPASEVYLHEMPGGQFTNLKAQARRWGWRNAGTRSRSLCRREPDVRRHRQGHAVVQGGGRHGADDGGQGLTRAQVEDPEVDVAFPDSVIDMLRGNLGQPPGGWPEAIVKKVLKGEAPLTDAPGQASAARRPRGTARRSSRISRPRGPVDDEDLNGYLMYPKVFLDYMGRHRHLRPGAHPAHRPSSTGWSRARRSPPRSTPARRWRSACRPWARPTTRARCGSSSN